ncbi:recombinase family protein [Marasmitruncus massiliensis]|uniref:recombinase family protein n=1 Tax=Marasmitruncus massiliensis TaxID=1944642 RepID=UPI000C7BEF5B|nr:recombinase family protein [Marasmitruncus massiliensis]
MRIGAAYVRVSTDDQLEFSPDSQLHKIKEYAKANDIVLSQDYIFMEDEGRSGRNANKRPEFQRMIGIAKSSPKPFDVILVWKFSRFARNREDSVVYKSMLRKKCNIDVVSVSEPVGDDKTSVLMEAIIEAMDEYYSVNLAEEVKRGMSEKAVRGGVVGSPAFGYLAQGGTFVPDPEKAPIVQMVFEKFVSGAGCRDLAVILNAMGVRTKKGYPMENRTVEYMLHNPVYVGKIRWSTNGKTERNYSSPDIILSEGHHEPIISSELFEQAQDILADRKKMYAKFARQSAWPDDFMLKGLVRCSDCGSTLVRSSSGLQCHSYAKGVCKVSHYISEATANRRVIDLIESGFLHEDFPLTFKSVSVPGNDNSMINAMIQREHTKMERIRAAYEDGIDTLQEYKENKRKILDAIAKLERNHSAPAKTSNEIRNEFFEKHRGVVADLRNPDISGANKNLILRGFVDEIVFDRSKNKFQVYCYL